MSYEATASCQYCGWTTTVTAHDTMQLRNEVYGAVNRHVCHEPLPDSCGVAWGDHRCTTAPYDHRFHLCRCGAQFDGAWCDIPGCDHRRSNRGYDMKPIGKVCADEPHGNNLDRTEQEA